MGFSEMVCVWLMCDISFDYGGVLCNLGVVGDGWLWVLFLGCGQFLEEWHVFV